MRAIERTRSRLSSRRARVRGSGGRGGLEGEQAGDHLQVVLHPVVDLLDHDVAASAGFLRLLLGRDVAHEHDYLLVRRSAAILAS